jgi:hypothetical protein
MEVCKKEEPPLADLGGGHFVACHLHPEPAKDTQTGPEKLTGN